MTALEKLLSEVKELDEKATNGPWNTERHGTPLPGDSWWTVVHHTGQVSRVLSNKPCDAEFIARARTLLPQLAEIVAALSAQCEAADGIVGDLQRMGWGAESNTQLGTLVAAYRVAREKAEQTAGESE